MSLIDRADAAMAATRDLEAEIARLRAENERLQKALDYEGGLVAYAARLVKADERKLRGQGHYCDYRVAVEALFQRLTAYADTVRARTQEATDG